MADNPYRPPRANVELNDVEASPKESKTEPKGLGGWLILVAFGLVATMFRLVLFLATNLIPIFTEGHWDKLTSPGSSAYHPLWAPLLAFEVVGNTLFVVLAGSLLYLFFTKSRWFPRIFIVYFVCNILFIVADYIAGGFIPAVAAMKDETLKELVRAVVSGLIWVPYMLVSKRVKNTFLGGRPPVSVAGAAATIDRENPEAPDTRST